MKKTIILAVIVLILVSSYYYFSLPKPIEFSNEPKDWIKENKIDIFYATQGKSYLLDTLQYSGDGINTAFDIEGFYKGKKFLKAHKINNKTVMRTTQELKPNDGIIDGFIFETIENDTTKAYLFVDEDWKKYIGKTNILWGKNFENQKEYDYKEIKKGIYMNFIIDDRNRFSKDFTVHTGGVMIGDISKEDSKDKTLIILR
ncbi:hypothetical protein HY837_05780 [archaeon]|nr:hypothetical protein [archaeon]